MQSRLVLIAALFVSLVGPSQGWCQKGTAGGETPRVRPAAIRGQLRLPDGHPAPMGIAVTLSYREGNLFAQQQTDSSGKFSFHQVPPGIYRVTIRAQGFREIETNDLDVNLNPMVYLSLDLQVDRNSLGAISSVAPGGVVPIETLIVPEDARKQLNAGKTLLEKSDYPKSIEHFKKAIKVYPDYLEAYLMMGLAYRAQHNLDEAGTALRKCIALNPNAAPAYAALGEVQNQKQEYAEAEKTLQKAVALNPESTEAQVELARSYWALGRWQDAEPYATKALALSPDSASAHLIMGNIDLRKRDGQGALRQFQEYLRLDPQGAMAPSVRDMVNKLQKALAQQ